MATNDFNTFGRQSGKVGNVVGIVRKGRQFWRGYTKKMTVSKSREALIVRAHFRELTIVARAFAVASRLGFSKELKATLMTPINVFTKKNWNAVTVTDPDTVIVDYGAIHIAEGNAPYVEFKTTSFAEEAEVSVTYESRKTLPTMADNDQVYLFVYQPDMRMGVLSLPSSRSAGSITVPVPNVWSGMQVHLYGFVRSAGIDESYDTSAIPAGEPSPSTYIGDGTIA